MLINNAGILRKQDSVDMDPVKHFGEIFNTNVRSYFLLARAVLPHVGIWAEPQTFLGRINFNTPQ